MRASSPPGDEGVVLATVAGLLALSLGPFLIGDLPAQVDYANHLARMTVLSRLPMQRAHDASFAQLPPRPRILVAHGGPPGDLPANAVLAVAEANAFVSTLFAFRGRQPVLPPPEFRRLTPGNDAPESIETLPRIARGETRPEASASVAAWTVDFDAVYVVGEPGANPAPEWLEAVGRGRFFTAYRIRHRAALSGP